MDAATTKASKLELPIKASNRAARAQQSIPRGRPHAAAPRVCTAPARLRRRRSDHQPRFDSRPPPLSSPSVQLTGRSGELVEQLYAASGKDSKKFEGMVKQLEVRARGGGASGGDGLLHAQATVATHAHSRHRTPPSPRTFSARPPTPAPPSPSPRRASWWLSSRPAWLWTASSRPPTTGALPPAGTKHPRRWTRPRLRAPPGGVPGGGWPLARAPQCDAGRASSSNRHPAATRAHRPTLAPLLPTPTPTPAAARSARRCWSC